MASLIGMTLVLGGLVLLRFIATSHAKYEDECRRFEGKLHAERLAREMKQDDTDKVEL